MHFRAVLFDWDGTLYDSIDASFRIYEELFKKYANLDLKCDYFRRTFIVDYHKYYAMHGIPKSKWKEVDEHWLERFNEMEGGIHLFPGIKELLEKLLEMNIKVGLVSNGTGGRIKSEMKKNGIDKCFSTLVTDDEIKDFKPNPIGIQHALGKICVDARDALYVGDMAEDVQAGKNAGTSTAAVTWGAHSIERLRPAEPDYIIRRPKELLDIL